MGPAAWALLAVLAPGVELRWRAPPGCPDAATVDARLTRYLGTRAVDLPVVVDAEVTAEADAWRLTLYLPNQPDTPRVLTNVSCAGLAEAAVVVIAIAVAPPEAPAERTPVDPPAIVPTPRVAPIDGTPPSPTPAAPRTPRRGRADGGAAEPIGLGLALGMGAGVGYGSTPVGVSLTPSIAVLATRWRAGVVAVLEPRRRLRLDDLPDAGSDLFHWAIGPEACWLPAVASILTIPVCGGFELGELVARPVGLERPTPRRSLWAAALASVGLRVAVHSRVALWLAPTAVIPLTPTEVVVGGEAEPLFRTTPVAVRGIAGLEVKVW